MTSMAPASAPRIARGKIYGDVYDRRVDDQEAEVEAELARAWLDGDDLRFAEPSQQARALADGVFLLRIPPGTSLAAGDAFARQFYQGPDFPPYGRFRALGAEIFNDPLLGFHERVNQIEQFLLEKRFWDSHYPAEIASLGDALNTLSRCVLRAVLAHVGIPQEDWLRATGGCSELAGSYHLTFNHYRPAHQGCGLSSHKDDGFLTILRTTAPGLEINRAGRWERVPVEETSFVINFGLSMEILTAASRAPVAAIMHRVSHQSQDRSSFGHFTSSRCEPGQDAGIYRYIAGAGLELVCASRELIDNNDHEIYQGTDRPNEPASSLASRSELP